MTQDNTGGDAHIGAAWMREQAAIACNVIAADAKEYNIPRMSLGASACCKAIRAIPLPTDADLLAEAMKLPEVAALVEASRAVIDGKTSTYKSRNGKNVSIEADDGEQCLIVHSDFMHDLHAALAPFTAAKETP